MFNYVFILNQYKTKLIINSNQFYKYLILFHFKRDQYLNFLKLKEVSNLIMPSHFSFFSLFFKEVSVELSQWYSLINNSYLNNYQSTFLFNLCFINHNTHAVYVHYKYKYLYYYRVYNFYIFYIFYYLYNHLFKVYKKLKLKEFKLSYDLIKYNEYNRYYLGLRTRMLILTIRNRYKRGFTVPKIFRNIKFFLRESMKKKELAGYYISIRGRYKRSSRSNKLIIKKDCEGLIIENCTTLLDFYSCEHFEFICFQSYFQLQQLKQIHAKPAIGWTSWYYYYTNISEKIIQDNLDAFINNNVPIEIFQIDDGWQKAVGDWLNFNDKFPNGLKNIVEKIKEKNIKAGLWLAPFACEQNSFIVKEKPHWILKDDKGKFLKIGFNPAWSYWFYALDFYLDEVRDYLKKVFHTILIEWNFDLVKLDFLYGTALIARNGKSRGQIMYEAMQFLRECVGDKMILGCGVPLLPANGTTEYCRIGPDIHLSGSGTILMYLS